MIDAVIDIAFGFVFACIMVAGVGAIWGAMEAHEALKQTKDEA